MSEISIKPQTKKYAWVILAIVYAASVSSGMMMNKVSPSIPIMLDTFGINLSQAGLLMSVFAFTAVLLAIPVGILISRLGQRTTAVIAFSALILGSVIGAVSESFSLLLFSRMLEGVGAALLSVLAPAMIAMWFPPETSGTPVGIWSTAIPVGGFLSLTFIPEFIESHGWQYVWWGVAAISLMVMVCFLIFFKPLPGVEANQESSAEQIANLRKLFKNKSIWLAGLTIMCFTLVIMPVVTYYPTFLTENKGIDLNTAGFLVGLISLATLPFSPLAGWFSDRIGSRKVVVIAGFLIMLPIFASLFSVSGWTITMYMILLGVGVASIPTPLYAAVPDLVVDVKMVGFGMAVLTIGLNLGTVIGAPVFGALVDSVGWNTAAYIFAPFALLGILISILNKKLR